MEAKSEGNWGMVRKRGPWIAKGCKGYKKE